MAEVFHSSVLLGTLQSVPALQCALGGISSGTWLSSASIEQALGDTALWKLIVENITPDITELSPCGTHRVLSLPEIVVLFQSDCFLSSRGTEL